MRRGFTLLETLVAVAILGLGITSVLQLIGTSARSAQRAQVTTEALFAAEELMEEALTLSESSLLARDGERGSYAERLEESASRSASARVTRDGAPTPTASDYSYALQVTPERNDVGLYRIEVRLSWREPSPGEVELATLRRFPVAQNEEEVQ